MFFANPHEALDRHDRRFHDPQFVVARKEGEPAK